MWQWRSRLKNIKRRAASSAQNSVNGRSFLTKSSGVGLAGAFILVGVLAVASAGVSLSRIPVSTHNSSQSQPATTGLQASQDSSSPPPPTSTLPQSATSSGVSTNVTSNSGSNGDASTQVTVNGQPVDVPDNSSTHQTINTPNGHTDVEVSHNQSTVGNSTNTSFTSTSLNTYSSSNTTTIGGN